MPSKLSVPSSGMTWMPSSYSKKAPAVDAVGHVAAVEVRVDSRR